MSEEKKKVAKKKVAEAVGPECKACLGSGHRSPGDGSRSCEGCNGIGRA